MNKHILFTTCAAMVCAICHETAYAAEYVQAPSSLVGRKIMFTSKDGIVYTVRITGRNQGTISAKGVTEYRSPDYEVPLTKIFYKAHGNTAEFSISWEVEGTKLYCSTLTSATSGDFDEFLPPATLIFTERYGSRDPRQDGKILKGYLNGNEVNTNLTGRTVDTFDRAMFLLEPIK